MSRPLRRDYQFELEPLVDAIMAHHSGPLHVAAPLGLGKPHRLLNAIYRRAKADPSRPLAIYTALSLAPPAAGHGLQARFLQPFLDRHFGRDFEALDYVRDLHRKALPANVHIEEFYLQSGAYLDCAEVQQAYASINYTHVARAVAKRDINLLVQKVARSPDGRRLSLSCNPDLSLDLLDEIARLGKSRPCLVAEVDRQLPFLEGSCAVDIEFFDFVCSLPSDAPPLFALPRAPVSDADHAIGLYASALVKDGGTLQIGIGALADALAHALILRHTRNHEYRALLDQLEPGYADSSLVREFGGVEPFSKGLYGASEMVNDAFRKLREAGILTRSIVDDLDAMRRINVGHATSADTEMLTREGRWLDGAFYLGSVDLYAWLRALPPEEARGIGMTRVSHINSLYGGNEGLEREQRRDARFFNTCMLMTALGAAASETLEDGRVVSGVGGQYNFVAMAHALNDSRSILMFRATHGVQMASSNVRWNYGNLTIPRHLRDIAITEYGVADLRDCNDRDCIQAMLRLTEQRFQSELITRAKVVGKLPADFVIDPDRTPNTAAALSGRLRAARVSGVLPDYPLGSDFSDVEQRLLRALAWLKSHGTGWSSRIRLLAAALFQTLDADEPAMERMGLDAPSGLNERLQQRLMRLALMRTRQGRDMA
ncbi:MAG TPA: acetyl-CoA hydrolase/transferase C-terminal domain-containing protein [Chiayiivirga sp.]|nr:acetyl-CoA hydrolase/transferase C-terminal domain-containing protein [Chiayiivirga sp.]